MKLEDKIIEKANLEKAQILSDAKLKAQAVYEKTLSEAKDELALNLDRAKKRHTTSIDQKTLEAKNELRDEVAVAKQRLVEQVFSNLKQELMNLDKQSLFNYVLNGLKNESIHGDEVIAVSKKDYDKYNEILSSSKGDLVVCDLLNQKLGAKYSLKLTKNPVLIKSGFMLLGKDYDLNFSIEDTLEKLEKKYEKIIYEELN